MKHLFISFVGKLLPGIKNYFKYKQEQKIIINYYNSNFSKCALLSYLLIPFTNKNFSHSHFTEVRVIAEALHEMGYSVDIIHWNNQEIFSFKKYDLVIGLGGSIERVCKIKGRPLVISYVTGSHYTFQNVATQKRLKEYPEDKRVLLKNSIRVAKEWPLCITDADGLLVIGNQSTVETFRPYRQERVFILPVPIENLFDAKCIMGERIIRESRNHFMFISSNGLLHKGLDLVLRAFRNHPELHLHILAPLDDEPGFRKVFKNFLDQPNIHTYGFVSMKSEKFKDILSKCMFVILPSCSEGQSSAVANVLLNGGLIPLITKEVGLDIGKESIYIQSLTVSGVETAIKKIQRLSNEDIIIMSQIAYETSLASNSVPVYKNFLMTSLQSIITSYERKS
jgi:hypothetical protein